MPFLWFGGGRAERALRKDRWQCENWLWMLLSRGVQLQGLWAESSAPGYVFMLGGLAAAAAPSQVISITTGDHGSR